MRKLSSPLLADTAQAVRRLRADFVPTIISWLGGEQVGLRSGAMPNRSLMVATSNFPNRSPNHLTIVIVPLILVEMTKPATCTIFLAGSRKINEKREKWGAIALTV